MNFGLDDKVIEKIKQTLNRFSAIESAIIYGSRAKGTYKPASDIDITLLGEHLDISVLLRIMSAMDDLLLPYTFDISILSQIDNHDLREHISRVGVEFYHKLAEPTLK